MAEVSNVINDLIGAVRRLDHNIGILNTNIVTLIGALSTATNPKQSKRFEQERMPRQELVDKIDLKEQYSTSAALKLLGMNGHIGQKPFRSNIKGWAKIGPGFYISGEKLLSELDRLNYWNSGLL